MTITVVFGSFLSSLPYVPALDASCYVRIYRDIQYMCIYDTSW